MKILITNDDGIRAPQMRRLACWAQKLGDVTVVAPKLEQSGKSQSIELHRPFEVKPYDLAPGIRALWVDSTPADCIRYAVYGMKETFDLVISGINRGYNLGTDVMYSGTAGAAFEAVSMGMQAVALSTDPSYYDHAADHLDAVFDFLFDNHLLELNDAYNVNIPPNGREFRITRQGGHYYADDFLPVGDDLYQAKSKCIYQDSLDDTLDSDAVTHGFISVMPMTICRTDMNVYHTLKDRGL